MCSGFGVLKKCCAMYSMSKGKLEKPVGEAIVKAADEVWAIWFDFALHFLAFILRTFTVYAYIDLCCIFFVK